MSFSLQLPDFRFTKTTLANGLDVVIKKHGGLPIVAVNLWYHVGSKNEERRRRGYAHLFEHLMFEGSEHYPSDFFKPLQRLGAAVNGSTSSDRTNYYEDLPAAHLELALAMESDRMACLIPAITEAKLRIQKDVVKNEYRQNYANRPYGMVSRILAEALYPPDHPYSWLTIGVMEDVEAATLDDLDAFFRRYYVPANASLCLAGDLDENHALSLAERYFGSIPGGMKALAVRTPDVSLNSSVELHLHDQVELTRDYLLWPTCRMFEADDAPLTLMADILSRGKSSRLYRKLVMEREIVQNISTQQSGRELAGRFGTTATLRPGRSATEAREGILAEIATIASEGPTECELNRVKNGRLAGFFHALENIGGFGGVADRLNAYNTYLGDPGRITTDFHRYQAVEPSAIQSVARRYLVDRPRISLTVSGRRPAVGVAPLDRSTRPTTAPPTPFRLPVPQAVTLRCGILLWVVPSRDLPIIAGTVVLGGGGAGVQNPEQAGLARLAASMMDEGTTTRTSAVIAEAAETLGTSLSTSSGWDGSYVSFQCLSPHREASLDLAVDVLCNPTFPESEWKRIQGQTLTALRAEHDNPDSRAYREFLKRVYPETHPYRMPLDGHESTVEGMTSDLAARFHRSFHGPSQAAIVIAGDLDPQDIARLLDDRLSSWSGEQPVRAEIRRPELPGRPRIVLLDRPGASQAAVRVGHVGLPRLHPDFDTLMILNLILGGQFSSRLNARLREEKGFTYGIRSYFDFRKGAGPFSISASLQSDKVGEALDDIRGELLALLDNRSPTEVELHDARRSLIEGQARHFETAGELVTRFAGLFLHELPMDHHAKFAERLNAVSAGMLLEAGIKHLHPQAMVAVVVADASQVAGQLERLSWADVELVTD